jgi:hypothetical protein
MSDIEKFEKIVEKLFKVSNLMNLWAEVYGDIEQDEKSLRKFIPNSEQLRAIKTALSVSILITSCAISEDKKRDDDLSFGALKEFLEDKEILKYFANFQNFKQFKTPENLITLRNKHVAHITTNEFYHNNPGSEIYNHRKNVSYYVDQLSKLMIKIRNLQKGS